MEKKFKFTQARLDSLSCPPGKLREYFRDTMRPELFLQVTKKGSKTYYCRAWHKGKGYTANKPIGRFEQIDLSEARRRARKVASLLAEGRDPEAEGRAALRQEMTFLLAYESFLSCPASRKKKQEKKESTLAGYEHLYHRHLDAPLGRRKLSQICSADIDTLHTRIGDLSGKYAANRARALVSAVFNDAIRKGWQGTNPALAVATYPERRRKRYLREDEIRPFLEACLEERRYGDSTIADAVLVALFTGLRRTNVCSGTWRLVNLERAAWEIPYSAMKNGEEHTVYLNSVVSFILRQRLEVGGDSEWIFPGNGRTGHLVEPKKGITRIVQRARIDPTGVSMHCLRHTFLTYADDAGLPSAIRKRLAGHTNSSSDVTAGYTHALESRAREAYEKVAQHILSFAGTRGTISHFPRLAAYNA